MRRDDDDDDDDDAQAQAHIYTRTHARARAHTRRSWEATSLRARLLMREIMSEFADSKAR